MQNYKLGEYIRQRRLDLGLTQEQVCAGICESVTLSRFENGKQTPSRNRINAILQRLGLPDDRYYALVTPEELEIEALKKEIVSCNALKCVEEGFDKISRLEKIAKPDDQITQQFILRSKVLLGGLDKAGEEGGANASTVFSGMGLAAIFKFIVDGLKMIPSDIAVAFSSFKGALGMEVYPALLGVGYIVGPKTASYMFAGSLVGWMVIIPLICLFGANISLYPAAAGTTIADLYAAGGADAIWSNYVKYIGAGAIATGGIISLIKSLPLIVSTFRDAMKSMKGGSASGTSRTDKDMPMPFILGGILLIILIIWLAPAIPVSPLGALLIVIFGFFFSTVSARMVGMIGSSNNPVSGMTIATLLIATMILKATGNVGIEGMIGSMAIASVICICAAIAADTSQDLKTGYLLGATPV